MAITKVWIDEGCIVCNACESTCPDVFHVTDETCEIVENLTPEMFADLEEDIMEAMEECPVEVIKVDED